MFVNYNPPSGYILENILQSPPQFQQESIVIGLCDQLKIEFLSGSLY